uniref:Uncharacterized protein n=1 Tax=mine drainage metagenome TaxID=410659 RepID=E6PXV1_9ZZZZ
MSVVSRHREGSLRCIGCKRHRRQQQIRWGSQPGMGGNSQLQHRWIFLWNHDLLQLTWLLRGGIVTWLLRGGTTRFFAVSCRVTT